MITAFEQNKMPPQVIIHGDCWPVVYTTEHVVKTLLPGLQCETTFGLTTLSQRLNQAPDALLILCLRPREHIFLFYALKNVLLSHPALVICDELLFSDRVVLHNWGNIPVMLHQEYSVMVTRVRQEKCLFSVHSKLSRFLSAPQPATGFFAVPMIFNQPKRLMNYMELLIHRATVACRLTPAQQKLLQELHRGQNRLSDMTGILKSGKRKIWQDKDQLLMKLGMRNRLRELLYGTRFCMAEQRTGFIPPEKAKHLFETANLSAPGEENDRR
ncbi:transcriptional regulator, partial [Salmonella enterica]|nr:transcriptional regulator [Salmonella enterica]